jgi:ribonuclease D
MPEQVFVSTAAVLEDAAAAIEAEPRIALDTESNGFHAYVERVCLVQIATPRLQLAVDTLGLGLARFAPLLADPAREIVIHAAEYDVMSLKRDFDVRIGRLFDTHAAAKVLGIERVGLANLLHDQLGIELTEDEQRSDWGRRPLTAEQLAYAYADVAHLLELRDRLAAQLAERGLTAEADAEFARLIAKEPRAREFDPDGWQSMKAARSLDAKGRGVLRELYLLRDRRARDLNRPAFKVLSDLFLAEVARRAPANADDLVRIPGASPQQVRKMAPDVLEAVRAGHAHPVPPQPRNAAPHGKRGRPLPPAPEVEERFEKLRAWRKARAQARKVEVQVIAPNAVLMAVARAAPRTLEELGGVEGMDAFRVQQYGDEILGALAAKPA